MTNELNAASGKLNSMTELADQALKRAKEVYDEALGLYAEVNTTLLPDIKLNKLKDTAREMNKTVRWRCYLFNARVCLSLGVLLLCDIVLIPNTQSIETPWSPLLQGSLFTHYKLSALKRTVKKGVIYCCRNLRSECVVCVRAL